jgi:hypothetical protein
MHGGHRHQQGDHRKVEQIKHRLEGFAGYYHTKMQGLLSKQSVIVGQQKTQTVSGLTRLSPG